MKAKADKESKHNTKSMLTSSLKVLHQYQLDDGKVVAFTTQEKKQLKL